MFNSIACAALALKFASQGVNCDDDKAVTAVAELAKGVSQREVQDAKQTPFALFSLRPWKEEEAIEEGEYKEEENLIAASELYYNALRRAWVLRA
jgi:hypothetical protein